ncbi:zf-HC2 domain-containing protein [Kitasatospora sp. NPDC050543]|uniref:zf-HC2 domain-containing protein n=1 Tax=Kitasatospora sp. NPDC050543 TaxID=3364054 RepID=UPI0037BB2FBA
MSAVGRSGPEQHEPGRTQARRGSGWAQLGRRGTVEPEPPTATAPPALDATLLPLRTAEPAAEEHHLGDRLSAFVDGELGHDTRDRVQAHLATCPQCLAEADEGRAVKHLLTHTVTPAPSSTLMARLLAVGALQDDLPEEDPRAPRRDSRGEHDDHDDRGDHRGGPGGGVAASGTLGGSRLNGGSFGRGAGASFGAGALGADAPLPGVDPRAFGRGSVLRPLMGRRSAHPAPAGPLAAAAPAVPVVRAPAPRGRRFVFAAAGAFSVAAVTLGGVGGLSSVAGEDQHGTAVTPARAPGGGGAPVPMTAPVPVDFPLLPASATHSAGTVPERLDRLPRSYGAGLHTENRP